MKEIIIIPHIGIGQLKLGMAPDELEKTLLQMKRQWSNSSNEAMQMERCAETDDPNLITGRYMDNDSFFLVQYRNGKATEIGIQRDLSKVASIIHSAVVLNMSIPNSFIDATFLHLIAVWPRRSFLQSSGLDRADGNSSEYLLPSPCTLHLTEHEVLP